MTQVGSPIAARTDTPGASFVEWGAVFAGAVLAAALSFVLLTFGTAIGLSATSPCPNSGLSAKVIASLAVFWAVAQQWLTNGRRLRGRAPCRLRPIAYVYITASLRSFDALKAIFLPALILMVSPVAGLRPIRAARLRT
jgi:hypothetical protein